VPEKKGGFPFLIHMNNVGVNNCACCRTEYTMFNGETMKMNNQKFNPKKIIAKVQYAPTEDGETPTHYVFKLIEIMQYVSKNAITRCGSFCEEWLANMNMILAGVLEGTDTNISVMMCECGRQGCLGLTLLNQSLWEQDYVRAAWRTGTYRRLKVEELLPMLASDDDIRKAGRVTVM